MIDLAQFDKRPVLVAIAGPNGAGKTTFFHAHLRHVALSFVNADTLAREMGLSNAYAAAQLADAIRHELVKRRESFVFETVFSDPVGDKVEFLKQAAESGYNVVLCYIGIAGSVVSQQRVAMGVSQGGHDVPDKKLQSRYPRTLQNLKRAIDDLPHVLVYDNNDLVTPFRQVAVFQHGRPVASDKPIPEWLEPLLCHPE